MPLTFEKVITANSLALGDTTVNKVKAFGQEVRMINIWNRASTSVLDTWESVFQEQSFLQLRR